MLKRKPLAKKMDYPATVRDGSTGELVNGYQTILTFSYTVCWQA